MSKSKLNGYKKAEWRGTLPVGGEPEARIGLSFDTETGETVRLSLGLTSARHIIGSLSEYIADYEQRSQSERSSDISSVEGSIPDDGENV